MKGLLLTLLILLLSLHVFTLICYTCDDGEIECKTVTNCSSEVQYCKTYEKDDIFNRTCEVFCEEDDFTDCCREDLCDS